MILEHTPFIWIAISIKWKNKKRKKDCQFKRDISFDKVIRGFLSFFDKFEIQIVNFGFLKLYDVHGGNSYI